VLNLLEEQLSKFLSIENLIRLIKLDHDGFLSIDLLVWLSDFGKQWMGKCLIDGDSEVWVEQEHLVKEINGVFSSSWVLLGDVDSLAIWESAKILDGFGVSDKTLLFFSWSTDDLENDGKLIVCRVWEAIPFLL
jgi:hypothetical protein